MRAIFNARSSRLIARVAAPPIPDRHRHRRECCARLRAPRTGLWARAALVHTLNALVPTCRTDAFSVARRSLSTSSLVLAARDPDSDSGWTDAWRADRPNNRCRHAGHRE
eukprot:6800079-Prymnesium_polylepis.4